MIKKLLCKCLISLGMLLLFALFIPFTGLFVNTANAAAIDTGKSEDYRLNLKSVTLVKGKSFTLKAYNLSENAKVNFKSDDQEIASVSGDGVITANKVGNTIITVTIKDGANVAPPLTCDVLVGPPAFSIKITKSRIIIGLKSTDYFLDVILKPSNTVEFAKFSSYDSSIVSVSTGGRINPKKIGLTYLFAEIEATDLNGKSKYDTCTVIVTAQEDAALLETYFSDHPELDMIPKDDLTKSLDEFFNVKYDPTSGTSLVNSLNRYLDDTYKLAELRAARDAALAKIQ
jgi:hypothetical protein